MLNKIALITGASSGIGKACAQQLAAKGANLVLCARRMERLQALKETLEEQYSISIHCVELDVRDAEAVKKALDQLPKAFKEIDVLLNNAGLASGLDKLQEGSIERWNQMIDTNVKGLLHMTRFVVEGMVERNQGHVVNIGSLAGHGVYPNGGVYCATKFAVKALSEALKMDVHGTNIRVSSVDPGLVETEFSTVRFQGDEEKAKAVYQGYQPLTPDDVADAVLYCVTRPAHVDVREVVLTCTAQTSATMVHKN